MFDSLHQLVASFVCSLLSAGQVAYNESENSYLLETRLIRVEFVNLKTQNSELRGNID